MIEAVRKALADVGVLDATVPAEISIIAGRSINVRVFPEGAREFYNVKLSRVSLELEYRALVDLESVLPQSVPHAYPLTRTYGLDALITKGIECRCVRKVTPALAAFVRRYHSLQLESPVFRSIHRPISPPVGFDWLPAGLMDFYDSLPAVKQHGDFLPMNMAVKPDGFVIFDWEDFGRVTLPGFDILMFLFDVYGFDAKGLQRLLKSADPLIASLRGHLLTTLNLKEKDFVRFVLLSLITYLHLKVRMKYRTQIIEDTRGMMNLLRCDETLEHPVTT